MDLTPDTQKQINIFSDVNCLFAVILIGVHVLCIIQNLIVEKEISLKVYIITWWTTVYLTKQRSYLNQ